MPEIVKDLQSLQIRLQSFSRHDLLSYLQTVPIHPGCKQGDKTLVPGCLSPLWVDCDYGVLRVAGKSKIVTGFVQLLFNILNSDLKSGYDLLVNQPETLDPLIRVLGASKRSGLSSLVGYLVENVKIE